MAEHLRRLLHLDLTRLGWRDAVAAVAAEARLALGSSRTLIALKERDSHWTAVTAAGTWLAEHEISLVASLTVLTEVWSSQRPYVATAEVALGSRSRSLGTQQVRQVLCLPLRWWERETDAARRSFGGALYLDRREGEAPFSQVEIEAAHDVAALTERLLSLLRSLDARPRLPHPAPVPAPAVDSLEAARLGPLQSRDPGFIARVLKPLQQAAQAERVNVLLLGPTGSGKTHLAQAFHHASRRAERPFVVFDGGQVASEESLAAELFGYAPHSGFSAPKEGRPGKARLAHGGTLFIDEVGALSVSLQVKLLRLLQDGCYTPLGASAEERADVQIVAATNAPLAELVERGQFREDLYWRLAELSVELPTLDQRRADIDELAEGFLKLALRRAARSQPLTLDDAAKHRLREVPWGRYGNLRGLQHVLTRAVMQAAPASRVLTAADLIVERPLGGASPVAIAGVEGGPAYPRDQGTLALRELLSTKIAQYQGNLRRMCSDVPLARAVDGASPPIAYSSLRMLVRRLGLSEQVERARTERGPSLERIVEALREHGSVSAAADALGITRDMLQWTLRRAGLSARQVRRIRVPEGNQ